MFNRGDVVKVKDKNSGIEVEDWVRFRVVQRDMGGTFTIQAMEGPVRGLQFSVVPEWIKLHEQTDEELARDFGLTVEQFTGEVPYNPDLSFLSALPCGADDAVMEQVDAHKRAIQLRQEWGRGEQDQPLAEYIAENW